MQVIDPRGPGGGASGGIVGALAPHVPDGWNPKKCFQRDSLLQAGRFWAEALADGGSDPGYGRTGRLQPVEEGAPLELARARSGDAARNWLGAAEWQVIPAREAGPFAPLSPSGWLIRDTLSARLHPRRAVACLAAALAALGGRLVTRGAPSGKVLWATGHEGLAELNAGLGASVGAGVKGQAVLLDFDAGDDAPQLFADGLHIVPHAGGTVAVGSTSENSYEDPAATDAQCDALIERARAVCPALADAPVLERWAGVRPRARSRAPMIGAHPLRPGELIANGGFKIGFGIAPAMAALAEALLIDGEDRIPEGFRPEASYPAALRAQA